VLFRDGLRDDIGAVIALELEGEGVEVAEDGEDGFMAALAMAAAEEPDGSGESVGGMAVGQEGKGRV
jgi:hypothetical protein